MIYRATAAATKQKIYLQSGIVFYCAARDRHKGGALTKEIPAKNVWQHTPSGTTPRQKRCRVRASSSPPRIYNIQPSACYD